MSSPSPDEFPDGLGLVIFALFVNLVYICVSIMKLGFQLSVLGEMPDGSDLGDAATAIAVMQAVAIACAISGMFTLLTKGYIHLLHTFFAFALGPIFLTASYAIHTTLTLKKKEMILSTCCDTASTPGGLAYIMGSWGVLTASPIPEHDHDPAKWCFQIWRGQWQLSLGGLIMVSILAAVGICSTLVYIWFETNCKGLAEEHPPVYVDAERQLLLVDTDGRG